MDTGSSCNIMSRALCKKLRMVVRVDNSELFGFDKSRSKSVGEADVMVCLGKWRKCISFKAIDAATITNTGVLWL